MFRAIGIVIILWYVSQFFSESIAAADKAGRATFNALEAAALASQHTLE